MPLPVVFARAQTMFRESSEGGAPTEAAARKLPRPAPPPALPPSTSRCRAAPPSGALAAGPACPISTG
jgi:hypothetical protein